MKDEKWSSLLKRNIQAIDDIYKKYNNDDTILCVTSGINISAFICYFYNIEPSDNTSWTQAIDLSPIILNKEKKD